MNYRDNPRECHRLSSAAGEYAKDAIRALAMAAACEEMLEDGSHTEEQLWFLVRALCHEHGTNYDQCATFARERARQIFEIN